ncbi:hypothetical protein [Nonomuraea gerenzanensis]|nr:hypothetical protein [Nonomuraea gerenzanensis]UBU12814.1 hypothetical protein LCN96_52590 [Nonomuraea gerenzanensis]
MHKRYLAVVAATGVAAATLLSSSLPAAATAPAQPLTFRGMTLYVPIQWVVHRFGGDVVQVVTGKCGKPQGWSTPECDAFYLLGPSYIKIGAEGFGPYTGKRPFYPSSDAQPCPFNDKWGEVIGPKVSRGLRQVGPGHKAAYNSWQATCVSYSSGKVHKRFTQREWYLPKSKILVVDQWSTPGLTDTLKHADWV